MEWFLRHNLPISSAAVLLPVAMVAVECTMVFASTVSKAAMSNGMSNFVLVVYQNALASFIFLPFSIFYRRRGALTVSLLCKFLLLGLIGSSMGILSSTGIKYSSSELAFAIRNLVPIFTYLLAITLRMEDPNLRSLAGVAKLTGAIVAVLGAITVSVYKGHEIIKFSSSSKTIVLHQQCFLLQQSADWTIGGLMLAIKSLLISVYGIFLTTLVREYPEKATILFFQTFFTAILSGIFSLIMERDPEAWNLKADIGLMAIICSAVFSHAFHDGVHAWCYQIKGPVYEAMFKPLGIVIAVVLGVLFLGDPLYLGSVIGSVIITIGFYAVIWGKAQEQKHLPDSGICCLGSSPESTAPLLQNRYAIAK